MTLTCEDANSRLVEVVTVAYVDAEDRIDNEFVADLGAVVWLKSSTFGQTLSTRFGFDLKLNLRQEFEAEDWSVNCR